jgi:hypothetical protein
MAMRVFLSLSPFLLTSLLMPLCDRRTACLDTCPSQLRRSKQGPNVTLGVTTVPIPYESFLFYWFQAMTLRATALGYH